ncbi:MAG: GAF domain-containing protein, partial [Gemmatimonadetes bacterium]|nr:GAF domain-containing protein [Gemmatimonadota bacterium]
MNTASTALAPLPPAILSLLDAFHQAHPGADVRLWLAERGGWLPLYPTDAVDGGPVESALRRSLSAERERSYELEVRGAAPASAVEVLAEALAQILAYEREARLAAQELTERYEEINLLYSISEILGSVLSLEAAARRILAEVADQLGAGRASLWVQDEGALRLIAAVGEEGLSGPIRVDDPHSVTARVFRERQPLNLGRGERPPAGSPLEPRPHDAEAYLSVPINYTPPEGGGRTVGVITLIGGKTHPEFTAGDARLLTAIASQIGAALETHRLVREGLRQERVARELELAHDLQM